MLKERDFCSVCEDIGYRSRFVIFTTDYGNQIYMTIDYYNGPQLVMGQEKRKIKACPFCGQKLIAKEER